MTTAWRQNIELFQQNKPETPCTNTEINEILVITHNNKILLFPPLGISDLCNTWSIPLSTPCRKRTNKLKQSEIECTEANNNYLKDNNFSMK